MEGIKYVNLIEVGPVVIDRDEAIMLVKLSIILFSNSHNFRDTRLQTNYCT